MGTTIYLDGPRVPAAPVSTQRLTARPRAGRPRVAVVVPLWWHGGVERQMLGMIRHSRHLVDWVGVWVGDHALFSQAMARELAEVTTIHDLQPDSDFGDIDFAVVWGWMQPEPWMQQLAGRIVAASHGAGVWNNNQLNTIEPYCVGAVAVSEVARETVPDAIKSRMVVIPNGVELDRIAPTRSRARLRAELGIGNRIAVGYVGRFSVEKNPLATAAAVGVLRRKDPNQWVAVNVGPFFDDAARAWHYQEAERLNPGGNLWIDPPQHVGDIYAALDCNILASPSEGFALVILECQAAGLPLVCTPVGRVPQMNDLHGQLQWQIDVGADAEQIAAQVVLATHGSNDPRVTRARDVIWTHHSAAKMATEWGEYFLNLQAQQEG